MYMYMCRLFPQREIPETCGGEISYIIIIISSSSSMFIIISTTIIITIIINVKRSVLSMYLVVGYL